MAAVRPCPVCLCDDRIVLWVKWGRDVGYVGSCHAVKVIRFEAVVGSGNRVLIVHAIGGIYLLTECELTAVLVS